MNSNLLNKLNELKFEEMVWILYIGIILLSFYSNSLEKKFFCYHDVNSKEKYQRCMIFIFSILVIVYLSFLKCSYDGIIKFIENLGSNYYSKGLDTPEKMNKKYAASSTWAKKVNKYVEEIKGK